MNELSPSREESGNTPTREKTATPLAGDRPVVQLGVYQLLAPIGKGGMGVVYRAWHTRLKRHVAVKTLPAERLDNPACVARFQREMEAIGKLDHPNLVRATDAGEERGVHFLVMEFVEGADACRLARVCGALSVADACEIVRQAAVGLQHAHEHGLVHRDIKPSNLIVGQTGQVKILDLGLALLHGASEGSADLTGSQHWMGTLDYMAPEQGQDAHRVDIRADVYSLGCTLYKLLTGQVLFPGSAYNTPYRKMEAHAHKPPPSLTERIASAPPGLAAVLDRMLAKDSANRFATPGEVAAALTPFVAGSDLARLVRAERAAGIPAEEAVAAVDTGSLALLTSSNPAGLAVPTPVPIASHPPAAAPAPTVPRWPRWRVAALLLSGILVVGLAAPLLMWRPRQPADMRTGGETPATNRAKWDAKPNIWHNVLDRAPKELLWPKRARKPIFEPQQSLLLHCDSMGLLALGTAPSGGYKFQVGLSQTRWVGAIGVFFGYREEQEDGRPVRRYQRLELSSLPNQGPATPAPRFALSRIRGVLREKPPLGWTPDDEEVASHPLPVLGGQEQILTVQVAPHGVLDWVKWEGQPLHFLTSIQANSNFGPRDYAGSFGVFTAKGTGEFTNARIMFIEKE